MYLQIKVTPKARTTEFVQRLDDGTLKIRIQAAPEKGKANEALIEFLAHSLGLDRSEIKLISGQSSQNKLVKVPDNTVLPWF